MAERITRKGKGIIKILVTGPESAGKTDLAIYLAEYYNGRVVPEYAREYIEQLKRPYSYEDVVKIAEKQRDDYHERLEGDQLLFFDTWLIITKVWFIQVFKRYPDWINGELERAEFDMVLVCAPDIPWEPDPVRENGGKQRFELFKRYIAEIEKLGWKYAVVEGTGTERYRSALKHLELAHFNSITH